MIYFVLLTPIIRACYVIQTSKLTRICVLSLCHYRIERSKVRVTFFENSKPQVISSPEFNSLIIYGDTVFGDTFANSQEVYVNGDLVQYSGAGDLLGSDENSNKMAATLTEIPPNYDRQHR